VTVSVRLCVSGSSNIAKSPWSNDSHTEVLEPLLAGNYTGLARDLVAVWPPQVDLDRIYEFPIGLSTHSHMHVYKLSADPGAERRSTREMLQLPSPGSHPALVARKLLFLGSIIQGALSASQIPGSLRERFNGIMSRAVDTATKLVTTNDALTASVEGVECIMIEAMIQNYTGNLHRAWMTTRRASAVAQALGLYRGTKLPSLKFLDPETKTGFNADHFCFRIVEMDRYLSITLGLPTSSLQTPALTPEVLARCSPLDRMARLHCILAGRMLCGERSGKGLEDLQEMEDELQTAASEMSPRWWLTPELASNQGDIVNNPFQEVARVNIQFSHYHLLLRLHMPYILRSSEYDHSKLAAASASREMLARYIAFRGWNPGHFYCRGADYLAFIALTVLCLLHVNSRNTTGQNAPSSTNGARVLRTSQLSDRGIMERTLDILKRMSDDATAIKLARIMQHLLDVEGSAVNGIGYNAVAEDEDGAVECNGDFLDNQNTLQLNIPYFGTIKLHRKLNSNTTEGATMPASNSTRSRQATPLVHADDQWHQQLFSSHIDPSFDTTQYGFSGMLDPTHGWSTSDDLTLQSINESLFSSLFSASADQDTMFNLGASPS
jgi:hypothetical protein